MKSIGYTVSLIMNVCSAKIINIPNSIFKSKLLTADTSNTSCAEIPFYLRFKNKIQVSIIKQNATLDLIQSVLLFLATPDMKAKITSKVNPSKTHSSNLLNLGSTKVIAPPIYKILRVVINRRIACELLSRGIVICCLRELFSQSVFAFFLYFFQIKF